VTEMTVATQPVPKHVGTALLFFDRLESAARAVEENQPNLSVSAQAKAVNS
jgi:hypothetical protein